MTAQKYREMREQIGSQDVVAKRLHIDKRTIQRRENGAMKIDREAELAIRCLEVWKLYDDIFNGNKGRKINTT